MQAGLAPLERLKQHSKDPGLSSELQQAARFGSRTVYSRHTSIMAQYAVQVLQKAHLGPGRTLHDDRAQREHVRVPPDRLHHIHLVLDVLDDLRVAAHPRVLQGIHLTQRIGARQAEFHGLRGGWVRLGNGREVLM